MRTGFLGAGVLRAGFLGTGGYVLGVGDYWGGGYKVSTGDGVTSLGTALPDFILFFFSQQIW